MIPNHEIEIIDYDYLTTLFTVFLPICSVINANNVSISRRPRCNIDEFPPSLKNINAGNPSTIRYRAKMKPIC